MNETTTTTKTFSFKGKTLVGTKLATTELVLKTLELNGQWAVTSPKGISGLLQEFTDGTLRIVWMPEGKMPRTETQLALN